MADNPADAVDDDTDLTDEEQATAPTSSDRRENIAKKPAIKHKLQEIFAAVEQGFTDQVDRSNDQMDYWDIYNCKLNNNQFYSGNSKIYVPIVHNAIEARVTRFANQVFPQSGRYVEVTSEDGTLPQATAALLEHYVRKSKLRTKVVPALLRNGDVEGQYTLYVSWCSHDRHVAMRVETPATDDTGLDIPETEHDDIHEETISDSFPDVEVIADSDLLVLPFTADTVEEAIADGGSVTILRRWTAPKIRQLIAEGVIDKDQGNLLIRAMQKPTETARYNKSKRMIDAAGIHMGENGKPYTLIYETWCMLKVKRERRICQAFYGGEERVLGARVNPNWSDRVPILSVPVKKIAGSFKGLSPVKFCADQQYAANDAANMGNDSAAYALMPVVMTDPEKNPRIGSMVLALSAIWETSPNDTSFAEFPQLWEPALKIVAAATAQIATTLSVSPAAITQQTNDKNLSQAEVSNEQQVDILTTADAVTVLEEGILTPLLMQFAELDHQYRDDQILVREYGEMGIRATMEQIPPLQMDRLYQFRWFGVEAAQNAQQVQQQIAMLNVLRGIPPQSYPGYQLNLAPAMAQMVENTFGPRLSPLLFQDMKSQLSLPAQFENSLLSEGIDLAVHPMDNDAEHMQVHLPLLQGGDPTGVIRVHLERHKMSLEQKTAASMAQGQMPPPTGIPGEPGIPGGALGGQAQPGVAGTPRIGAQPGGPRPNGQGPPGLIHQDQLQSPSRMPRAQRQ